MTARLQVAVAPFHALAVDLSDARRIFRIGGLGAREVVMKGASVDLTRTDCDAGTVHRLTLPTLPQWCMW